MTATTGTATRIGTMARYRSMPDPDPPAGTPWSCRTTRPATDAAIAVTSATGRRQGRAGPVAPVDRVSALVMRAGLAGGSGQRGQDGDRGQRPAGRGAAARDDGDGQAHADQ